MKIKIFALLLTVVVALLSFVACGDDSGKTNGDGGTGGNGGNGGNGGGETCQHTFSEAWASDKSSHWHQATCEHGEIKDSLAYHSDVDEDGKCDVCEYEVGHSHYYATSWSYDEEYHWKAAICTHKDEKNNYALHYDDNQNGECDICKGHVHIVGPSGFCQTEGCGKPMTEIDKSNFESIVNAVLNQSSLVNGVEIQFVQNAPSNNADYYDSEHKVWQSYNRSIKQNISVLFGKNGYVHSFTNSEITSGLGSHQTVTNSTFESWYEAYGKGAFGVVSENGEAIKLASIETSMLDGSLYTLSTVASAYGTENFLYELYLASQGNNARDFAVVYATDENKINFRFNILSVNEITGTNVTVTPGDGETGDQVQTSESSTVYNVHYYEIEASFSYDERFVLTNLDVSLKVYTNEAGTLNDKSKNLKDVTLKYYPENGTFDFVKYDASYNPDGDDHYRVVDKSELNPVSYSYSVTQSAGDRTADNEHSKESLTPKSFNLYTDIERTTKLEGTVNVAFREFIYIYLDGSVDYVFDLVDYEILDANGNVIEGTDIMEGNSDKFKAALTYGPEEGRYFMLFPLKSGNYTLVITYQGKIAHQVNIVVK